MLGIALTVMLGFILFRHMPRKPEEETGFQQSLFWAKVGVACFIGQIIWMLAVDHLSLFLMLNAFHEPLLQGFIAYIMRDPLYPFSVMSAAPISVSLFFIFIFLWPSLSAGLTQVGLVKTLSEKKAPSQNWFHLIGLFSAAGMGGALYHSLPFNIHTLGIGSVLQALAVVLFFFAIMLVGIFAVETSRHRLSSAPS